MINQIIYSGHLELMDILKSARDNYEYRPVYDEGSWIISPEYIEAKLDIKIILTSDHIINI